MKILYIFFVQCLAYFAQHIPRAIKFQNQIRTKSEYPFQRCLFKGKTWKWTATGKWIRAAYFQSFWKSFCSSNLISSQRPLWWAINYMAHNRFFKHWSIWVNVMASSKENIWEKYLCSLVAYEVSVQRLKFLSLTLK